ncbi:hypothetical protein CDAR_263641 [Caerostris darwini]|uniref:Uncharacterized protein n=1 Tax=Caerostris darwini TaxID=1538125 RepID=A0AAV4RYY8_9ARAC|nr:hypothetical protein CDAR_263641 [Caerostris darwini]
MLVCYYIRKPVQPALLARLNKCLIFPTLESTTNLVRQQERLEKEGKAFGALRLLCVFMPVFTRSLCRVSDLQSQRWLHILSMSERESSKSLKQTSKVKRCYGIRFNANTLIRIKGVFSVWKIPPDPLLHIGCSSNAPFKRKHLGSTRKLSNPPRKRTLVSIPLVKVFGST